MGDPYTMEELIEEEKRLKKKFVLNSRLAGTTGFLAFLCLVDAIFISHAWQVLAGGVALAAFAATIGITNASTSFDAQRLVHEFRNKAEESQGQAEWAKKDPKGILAAQQTFRWRLADIQRDLESMANLASELDSSTKAEE